MIYFNFGFFFNVNFINYYINNLTCIQIFLLIEPRDYMYTIKKCIDKFTKLISVVIFN
jgi:hypothetical protein